MQKLVQWLIMMTLALVLTKPCFAENIVTELANTYITHFEFGIYRLGQESKQWARDYFSEKIDVNLYRSGEDKIVFWIDAGRMFGDDMSKDSVANKCKKIVHSFLGDVLSNFGNPNEVNIRGDNMYFIKWGSYFAPLNASPKDVVLIGESVAKEASVHIFTGVPNMKECVIQSNVRYRH